MRPARRTLLRGALTSAALAGVAIVAIGTPALRGASAGPAAVNIVDYGYVPATITVAQHQAVTWSNTAGREHTVTADDGTFDSQALSKGDSFGNVFDTAGTFTYHCTIHPERMKGTVIVTAASTTPTPSGPTAPPGTLPPNFSPSPSAGAIGSPASPTPSASPGPTTPSSSDGSTVILAIALLGLAIVLVLAILLLRRRRPA